MLLCNYSPFEAWPLVFLFCYYTGFIYRLCSERRKSCTAADKKNAKSLFVVFLQTTLTYLLKPKLYQHCLSPPTQHLSDLAQYLKRLPCVLLNPTRLFTCKKYVFPYIRMLHHIRLFISHYYLQLVKEGKCMKSFVI
jgi:hypothetical protein